MMPFERNDQVRIFGKTWRIDWRDGGWLGISNDEGEHKEVHVHAVERERQIEDIVRRAE